jgi:hypothetical protein
MDFDDKPVSTRYTDKPVGDRLTLIALLLTIIAVAAVWSWAVYVFD